MAEPRAEALARVVDIGERRPDVATRPAAPAPVGQRRSDVDAWGRSERARSLAHSLYGPVYRNWFRVEWEGLQHVPIDGGALLVANHAAAIPTDAPSIMHGIETQLHRPVYGLADYRFRSMPWVGLAWSRFGGVVAHPDNAVRLLRDERQLVLVFPEGSKGTSKTYRQRYQLRRFGRGGFVEIAMRAGVPIIPIAAIGTEEAMPMVATFPALARRLGVPYAGVTANMLLGAPLVPFPAKYRFHVLPPVTLDAEPNLARYSSSKVMDAADHIRSLIQDELHAMLAARQSVWRG
jgi:1-acyl-sn-glycerol-3-phosphate acyltransferase